MKLGVKVCAPCNRLSQLQNLTSICKHLPRAAAAAAPIQIGVAPSACQVARLSLLLLESSHVAVTHLLQLCKNICYEEEISYLCLDAAKYR